MRRRHLLAYVIGAALAGTMLVFPYAGRALLAQYVPTIVPIDVPFFLLPIAWGMWNVLWVKHRPAVPAAAWGALLGVLVAIGGNLVVATRGQWSPALLLLGIWVPSVYALGWAFVIAPLNRALGAEP